MYRVILTSLFFLIANIGSSYSYIKSDDTAERIEFQSLMGTHIWDRNQKEHTASGYLWMPDKEAFPGKRPLVILLPGMGGMDGRDNRMCSVFISNGIACFGARVYPSRGVKRTKTNPSLRQAGVASRLFDGYAALHHLTTRPDIEPNNAWLIGFSAGGLAAALATYSEVTKPMITGEYDFRGFVNIYGGCPNVIGTEFKKEIQYHFFIGTADVNFNEKACKEYEDKLQQSGVDYTYNIFRGSQFNRIGHQWDLPKKKGNGWVVRSDKYKWGNRGFGIYKCNLTFDFDNQEIIANGNSLAAPSDEEGFDFMFSECGIAGGTSTPRRKITKEVDEKLIGMILE